METECLSPVVSTPAAGSNLGPETGYLDPCHGSPQFLKADAGIIP
jgi:hypothetical protein